MIYKYKKFIENSINGVTLDIKGTELISVTPLGEINGFNYAFLDGEVEQDSRINAIVIELTKEEKDILKSQMWCKVRKNYLRDKINIEVGDVEDILADSIKMLEINFIQTAKVILDVYGVTPLAIEEKDLLINRSKKLLDSVSSGEILLRSNLENTDDILDKTILRLSKINNMVKDEYIKELEKVNLI
jgi:hypothetical protein